MKLFLFFLLITSTFLSCKNEKQEAVNNAEDSIKHVLSIRQEDSTALFGNNIDEWIAKEINQKELPWQYFHLQEYYKNDSIEAELIDPPATFYKNYESVLRWSPDSNYILDIGSYGSVLVKDKNGRTRVEAGEPDSEVSLLQPAQNAKWSLFFVGPSSIIYNAVWVNNFNALILGTFDEQGNSNPDTLFWMVNVKDNFFRMYKMNRK